MKLFTSGAVCEAVGIPAPTLEKWVREGAITPVVESSGRGTNRMFTAAQIFAIAASRHLRHKKDHDLRTAGGALQVLLAYSDEALQASFAAGKNSLILCNGTVLPKLESQALAENEGIRRMVEEFAAAGIRCDLEAIEIEQPYRRLQKWLQSKERKGKVRA